MSYLGENTPKLGFGLMRLPKIESADPDAEPQPDIEQIKQMVDLFLERGYTYFDTARAYGFSEAATKEALVDRHPRDSYTLATKNNAWRTAQNAEEAKAIFTTSLETTGAGYFDYYLFHNMGGTRTHVFDDFGMWEWAAQQKEAGLIRHLGASIHDKADVVDSILTAHPELDFVQLQINYADWEDPIIQSRLCYEACRRHNKPIVIMEPIKGGTLTRLPQRVEEVLREANPDISPAQWAIRFAASLPGVITVLSGMSTLEQMDENTTFMQDFKPLTEEELAVLAEARKRFAEVDLVSCTACEYCKPGCPQEIAIPEILATLNMLRMYDDFNAAKFNYGWKAGAHPASTCIDCKQCESVCPQSLAVVDYLREAADLFEDKETNS